MKSPCLTSLICFTRISFHSKKDREVCHIILKLIIQTHHLSPLGYNSNVIFYPSPNKKKKKKIGSRRGSRNNSYTSATSTRSNRSGNANQPNKAGHHHLDGKCRVPTTVMETTNSTEPIMVSGNHETVPVTMTTNASLSPLSTSPNMVDL